MTIKHETRRAECAQHRKRMGYEVTENDIKRPMPQGNNTTQIGHTHYRPPRQEPPPRAPRPGPRARGSRLCEHSPMASRPPDGQDLEARLAEVGRRLGEREASHSQTLAAARSRAETLRAEVARALEAFHAGAAGAGAPQLRVVLGEVRLDDKHARAVQFDLARGRCAGIDDGAAPGRA